MRTDTQDGIRKRLFSGAIGIISVTTLGIGQQLLLVPLFLHVWSAETYAAWVILFSVTTLMSVADFGLHPLAINKYQVSINDETNPASAALSRQITSFISAYVVVTTVSILTIVFITIFGDPVRLLGLGGASHSELKAAFVLAVANGVVINLTSGCTALYRSHLRTQRLLAIRVVVQAATIILQIVFLLAHCSIRELWAMLFLVNLICLIFMAYKDLPSFVNCDLTGWWRISAKNAFKTIGEAFPFLIPGAADQVLNQLSVFALALVSAPQQEIVLFNLCRLVTAVPRMLAQQLSGFLGPEVGTEFVRGNEAGLRLSIRHAIISSSAIIGITSGAMYGLINPLFQHWTSGKVPFQGPVFWPMMISLTIGPHIFAAFSSLIYTNKPKIIATIQLVRLTFLFLLTVILAARWGALGAALALLTSELMTASIPFYLALLRYFPIKAFELIQWSFVRTGVWFVTFAVSTEIIAFLLGIASILEFGMAMLLTATAAAAAFYWEIRTLKP